MKKTCFSQYIDDIKLFVVQVLFVQVYFVQAWILLLLW